MPPPFPSSHRGMTANPLKPVGRYRPGKPVAEEPSSSEEEDEEEEQNEEEIREQERKWRIEEQRRRQAAPKAGSFPAGAARGITKGVEGVKIEKEEEDDEEGFITDEEDELEETGAVAAATAAREAVRDTGVAQVSKPAAKAATAEEEEEEESEEEESSEEESSSEDEAPRRVLLRPTFIKKDKRGNGGPDTQNGQGASADSQVETEARKAQRQEKADALVREQIEKDAIARSAANRAWDDDEVMANEEAEIDDTDNKDPEAEYAAWKLRELKRIKREREAIEASEKEREEIERRRNLTAEEREREDQEFIAKQKEEREATRGQTGFMQRYFHKGAFFRPDLEKEGLDQRNVMGARFADDVSRETLPQYMQIRDMTKLGKKGRTRYKDLRSEDTGRFGDGYSNRRRQDGPPIGITDERFMPDRGDDRARGPTGANASALRERRRSRSRSRSHSPRRDRRDDQRDRYRPDSRGPRKRSPSPYEDREKRRRMRSVS
ncbi:splicing factor, Prp19-binding domain-containing protein [Aspergillus pseudoustus]|uniref:Splicing factor, Prp19-binding domain-containing protein n=1 Tax=Aspergillus pseudoustus TaxID=1810923 RepID=A0ABR4KJM6_9EURO